MKLYISSLPIMIFPIVISKYEKGMMKNVKIYYLQIADDT